MILNPDIFKAYDIRGVYGKDFDDRFAYELGNKLAQHFRDQKIVVGRDDRSSSDVLEQQVLKGIEDADGQVVAIGHCTTPLFYFSVGAAGASVGIMMTASHNPGEYNGFKVMGGSHGVVSGVELKGILENTDIVTNGSGHVGHSDFRERYVNRILEIAEVSNLTQLITIHGPSSIQPALDLLHKKSGLRYMMNEADGGLVVTFDTDADRITFSEDGQDIPLEFVFSMLVEHDNYQTVVHDLLFSRACIERFAELGKKIVVSGVGHPSIYMAMQENNADIAAETSGHIYFKNFGYFEAPELVLLQVLRIMQTQIETLAGLTSSYRKYFKKAASWEVDKTAWPAIAEKIKKTYSNYKITELDGISIDAWDDAGWWCNIRLSNTEPLLRLTCETKTLELLDHMVSELRKNSFY